MHIALTPKSYLLLAILMTSISIEFCVDIYTNKSTDLVARASSFLSLGGQQSVVKVAKSHFMALAMNWLY